MGSKNKGDDENALEQYKILDNVVEYFPNGVQRLHSDLFIIIQTITFQSINYYSQYAINVLNELIERR